MIAGQFTTFNLDAIGGLLISLFILYGGWGIVKDTIDLLLGPAPDPEVVEKVTEMVRAGEHVVGAHDLVMHDYGPSHTFASIHADIPENMNLAEVHASMTALENKINEETGINIVVYPDPIKAKVQKMEKVEKVRDMDLMQVSKSIG
jgi:divalent metal cation (Fe/Co/Zn/Cd) transporter